MNFEIPIGKSALGAQIKHRHTLILYKRRGGIILAHPRLALAESQAASARSPRRRMYYLPYIYTCTINTLQFSSGLISKIGR